MALAALLAGMAFSNVGVALVHAMEYPVGGAVHCSHGAGNGLLLPYVMRFNLPARVKAFGEIARMLGENVTGLSEQAAAEKAVDTVEKLRNDIGIPQRLRDIGVKTEQLRSLAEKAHGIKRILRVNPRSVTVEDVEGIFQQAY
jgi:alcohol dehydrogenase class IV